METLLGRVRRTWENNKKINLKEVGWKSVDWVHLVRNLDRWLAFVNTVMNLRVP
jgi:hypothetical protein